MSIWPHSAQVREVYAGSTYTTVRSGSPAGKLHYIVVSDSGQGSGTSSAISAWVKANGTAVSDYSGVYRLDTSDVG
ncbi:hypothetical protein ACFYO2_12725 [Streptomyces sp. NPDC006602]|uniref:hypothetical protein n=1 Tax=Streptomyces sp. NPDC006602 TaxID=3364751 RepID=UPI0036A8E550